MNILTINTSASQGGAALIAHVIHEALNRKRGMCSVFVSGRNHRIYSSDVVSLGISWARFLINVFCYRIYGAEGVLNQKAWRRIIVNYYSWADVIHLHNVHGYYLPKNILDKLLKKPVVWTLHDYWLGTRRCAVPRDCVEIERKCMQCPYPHRYPSMSFRRNPSDKINRQALILKSSAQFVVPSVTSREKFIGMGIPDSRLHVIENPLDFPNDTLQSGSYEVRGSLGLPPEGHVVIFIANQVDDPNKGFAVLLDALSQLPIQHQWTLVVIGKVSKKLKKIALSKCLNILFTGPIIDRRLISQYLMASNCLVNPSYSETFGLVNLEAFAAGCSVVCSDIPVFREFECGVTRFFNPGDSKGLALALVGMYGLAVEAKDAQIARAKYLSKRFSVEKACSQYINIYEGALENTKDKSNRYRGG